MMRKFMITCFFTVFIYGLTACGSQNVSEQVVAMEPEVLIIKDEPAVPLKKQPSDENTVTGMSIVPQEELEASALHMAEVTTREEFVVLPAEQTMAEGADGIVDETDFTVAVRGTEVILNDEINRLMPMLGFPEQFTEEINSRGDGSNKHYVYGDVIIHTEPEAGRDIVKKIELGGEEKTLSGMAISCTRADIEAAYGIEYVMDPEHLTYMYMGEYMMSFHMNGEECDGIELSMVEE